MRDDARDRQYKRLYEENDRLRDLLGDCLHFTQQAIRCGSMRLDKLVDLQLEAMALHAALLIEINPRVPERMTDQEAAEQ